MRNPITAYGFLPFSRRRAGRSLRIFSIRQNLLLEALSHLRYVYKDLHSIKRLYYYEGVIAVQDRIFDKSRRLGGRDEADWVF